MRMGWKRRTSSHSARRGASVAAVMAGLPLHVVQAFETWESADTVQIYVAEAICNEYCALEMLDRLQMNGCR